MQLVSNVIPISLCLFAGLFVWFSAPLEASKTGAQHADEIERDWRGPIPPDVRNVLERLRRATDSTMTIELLGELEKVLSQRLEYLHRLRDEQAARVAAALERLTRLKAYCDNGSLYFRKTLLGFGPWVEEDESSGEATPIAEFDLNNVVLNRLLELQAAGWKNKIPAKTVACGPGVQAIYDVLR